MIPESDNQSKYSINLPDDATGTFTVTVDGKNYTQNVVNGNATVIIPKLSNGNHILSSYTQEIIIVKSNVINVNNIATYFDTADVFHSSLCS